MKKGLLLIGLIFCSKFIFCQTIQLKKGDTTYNPIADDVKDVSYATTISFILIGQQSNDVDVTLTDNILTPSPAYGGIEPEFLSIKIPKEKWPSANESFAEYRTNITIKGKTVKAMNSDVKVAIKISAATKGNTIICKDDCAQLITFLSRPLDVASAISPKIKLIDGDTTLSVYVLPGTKNSGKQNNEAKNCNEQKIKIRFALSGTAPNSDFSIRMKIDSLNSPSFLCADEFEGKVDFTKAEWPDDPRKTNSVTKEVTIKTSAIPAFSGEEKISLVPDMNDALTKDVIFDCASCKMLVKFNKYGVKRLSPKYDYENTLKTDFAFYTDFLGVEDDKPNGLFQAELGFKIPLNKSKPIRPEQKPSFLQPFRSIYTSLNFMSLENLASSDIVKAALRIKGLDDSSFILSTDTVFRPRNDGSGLDDSIVTKNYAQRKQVNSFDLYRWASFSFKSKINILSYRHQIHRLHLDYTFGILRTPSFDSLADKRTFATVFIHGPGIFYETNFKQEDPLFNLRFLANYYMLRALGNDFEQVNAPVIEANDESRYANTYKPVKWGKLADFSLRLAWFYNSGNESANATDNQIFVRTGLTLQLPWIDGERFSNKFFQFQVGGNFDINNFFKPQSGIPENKSSE